MVSNPFRYSGEFWDDTTKIQYLRARWYDPSQGRFLTEDTYEGTLNNPLSLNLYSYVHNNPLGFSDPTGHWDHDNGLNWMINDCKLGYMNAQSEEDRAYYAAAAAHIREEMRNAGYAESDIMEASDPAADLNAEMSKNHPIMKFLGDITESAADYYLNGPGLLEIGGVTKYYSATSKEAKATLSALLLVPEKYRIEVALAFNGSVKSETLSKDLVVYRHWGGGSGQSGSPWFSPYKFENPADARKYLALPDCNTAKNVTEFVIPKGTTILRGEVAPQVDSPMFGSYAIGGGEQIYLPDPSVAYIR